MNIKTDLNAAKIAVDAIKDINVGAYVGTDGLFATDALANYRQQLEGLTVTQQKMALMGTNLTAAQREQVLAYISATAATKTLTAEQVLNCTADEKQLLVKAGLITADELEKGSTIDLIRLKLEELIANKDLSASEKNVILNKFGVAGANLTEASSWEVLGKSILKSVAAKLKWLALTPEGWITLGVAAVVGAIVAYNKWGATLENTREKLVDLKSECDTITSDIESVNSELETTKQRLDELEGKDTLTFTEKEEYDNLVKQNNELQRQLDLQKLLLDEKNKEKNKTFVQAMDKNVEGKRNIVAANSGGSRRGKRLTSSASYTVESNIEQQIKNYQENLDKIADLDEQYKDDLSNKKYLKERERIENENDKISEYLQSKNTEFVTDSESIEYIDEPKNEDEEKVNKWLDFINDFQDRMTIAMGGDNAKQNAFNRVVDNWQFDDTVQGLQDLGKEGKVTADMLDDPKYADFIQKLVELKVIDSADNLEDIALAFNSIFMSADSTTANIAKLKQQLNDYKEALEDEYKKIDEWGLGDYADKIKDGTLQSVFGNVDMDKRTIITWSDELKETYKDALDSWGYDPEIGSVDTVFGMSERFGEDLNGSGWEVAFTPILPDGTFLSKDTVNEYINTILQEAYADDGKVTEDELKEIDAQGMQIGETFVKGIFAGMDASEDYGKDGNGNKASLFGKLMHFAGKFGAIKINTKGIEDTTNALKEAEKASASVTASLDDLEAASDKIGKLASAYKELSDDGYITISTINELKEATGLSGDEWTAYETKLLNAKKGSAEFNQVMSDLTYKIIENNVSVGDLTNATDEEVAATEKKIAATLRENGVTNASAVAHDYVRVAKVNEAIASYDGTQASYDEAAALISESLSADQAKVAMNQLEIAKKMVNSAQIKTASDIDEIIALANAAGASVQFLQDLALAKHELADGFVGPVSSSTSKIMNGEYTPTFNKLNPSDYKIAAPKYTPSSSGSGSKSSGSDKNDALDNYLEDAERRYKIHQDETKYINDLEYALSNLAKTEEERRDILDDIEQARKDYANNRVTDIEHQIEMLQNLKGETVDVLEYYDQIQAIAHEEADRLRAYGYDDNSNEVQEWQSKWWDAQDKKMDFCSKQHEDIISDIEHARDMALAKNPYMDTTSYYKQMQEEYHKLAELYRSINSEKYKKEIQELQQSWQDAQQSIVDWRWENSQNWINLRNTYGDWDKFGDNEVNAWERVLKWLKADFPEALDKIQDATQSLYEAIKSERDEAVTAAEKFRDEIEDTYDKENERYERLISREQGLLDIKTKTFEVTNKLAEAQHEADKAIASSRISKQYLTSDEYALIYNEEDYEKISDKINDISVATASLTTKFQKQVEAAYANGQEYLIEYITAEYERQLEMKERELEIAQAEVDLAKKKQQLENVLAEKNVRQMTEKDGKLQWIWVADTDKVKSATEEYADAQYNIDKAEAELKQEETLNSMQKNIDMWNRSISVNDSKLSALDDTIDALKTNVDNLNNPVTSFTLAIEALEEQGIPSLSQAVNDMLQAFSTVTGRSYDEVTVPNGKIVKVNDDGWAPKGLSAGTMVETGGGYYLITDVNKDGSYQSVRTHYARGTSNTRSGAALMGEDGFEAFVSAGGQLIPIEQPTIFKDIDAGGKVFNAEQLQNLNTLWKLSNDPSTLLRSMGAVVSQASYGEDNSVTLNGDIVVQNPANFDEFTQKLITAFKRRG